MFLLTQRAVLLVKCRNFIDFLQKVSTNDFSYFDKGIAKYTMLLHVNGTIITDLFVMKYKDIFLLEYDISVENEITKYFKKYTSIYDFTIYKLDFKVYQFFTEEMQITIDSKEKLFFIDPRNPDLGYRLWSTKTFANNPIDYQKYETLRIKLLIPELPRDIKPNISIPSDFYMEYGISRTKGCYVGQEIIARLQVRQIKKNLFTQFSIDNKTNSDNNKPNYGLKYGEYKVYSNLDGSFISNAYIATYTNNIGLIVFDKYYKIEKHGEQLHIHPSKCEYNNSIIVYININELALQ